MFDWDTVERSLRQRAYASLDNDPQILLATDAHFTVDADLFYARLIGFEDEIVRDAVQLPRVVPEIFLPIPRPRLTLRPREPGAAIELSDLGVARYVLQTGHVVLTVSGEYGPPIDHLDPETVTARVVYLRYRRRA